MHIKPRTVLKMFVVAYIKGCKFSGWLWEKNSFIFLIKTEHFHFASHLLRVGKTFKSEKFALCFAVYNFILKDSPTGTKSYCGLYCNDLYPARYIYLPHASGIHMGSIILQVILGVTLRYRCIPSINIPLKTTNHR